MKNTICILKGVDKTDEVHKFRQLSAGLYAVKFYNIEKEFNLPETPNCNKLGFLLA